MLTSHSNIARKAFHVLQMQRQDAANGNSNSASTISPALAHAYVQITNLTSQSIVQMRNFETLVCSLTSEVKTAYAAHNLSGSAPGRETTRNEIECNLMLGGGKYKTSTSQCCCSTSRDKY